MLHKTIKAAATATDEGKFTAIAAAYTVDRTNEKILPGAFEKTIARWQESSKMIPVHWDHEGDPESIIGHADPKSMREAEEGLYVRGQLDLEGSEKARAAWRVMKDNSIGLSFGYLVTDDETIDDVKHLKEIDLFEISITPAPVNPDTRIVSMKSTNSGNVEAKVTLVPDAAVALGPGIQVSRPADASEWSQDDADQFREDWQAQKKLDAGDDPEEVSEEVAADLRKGYDKLEIDLMAAEVPEAEPPDDNLSDVEDEVPDEEQQIEDARTEEPPEAKVEAQDPLRRGYDELALELLTRGIDVAEPPKVEEKPTEDPPSMEVLRRRSYDLMLETLIGSEKT